MTPLQSVLSDPKRLAALGTYQALDTPPEFEQDALTGIAAEICGFGVYERYAPKGSPAQAGCRARRAKNGAVCGTIVRRCRLGMSDEAQTQGSRYRVDQSGGGCERIANAGRRAWGYFWGYARSIN